MKPLDHLRVLQFAVIGIVLGLIIALMGSVLPGVGISCAFGLMAIGAWQRFRRSK